MPNSSAPTPIVALLILFEGRVLLVRRAGQGWTFPAAPLRRGERLHETARRAVAESVGLTIDDLAVLDVREHLIEGEEGEPAYHYLFLYFTAHPVGGSFRTGAAVEEARWFSPDETLPLGLSRDHRRLILQAVRQADFSPRQVEEAA